MPTDDLLNRAFDLSYFILGDRTSAIYLAMAAIDRLKVASAMQDRRLNYKPTGRASYPASRSKVSLSDTHLLQRLIYTESEPFERLLEAQERPLQQSEMIIRYIKHLVRLTTKHNSFYVALGLCRLLHNYTTSETIEIYNLVIQDPDRGRDDYYYRSRKRQLLRELKDRFEDSLTTDRGYRGEERFRPAEDSLQYTNLVRECLLRFMPWDSPCVLPDDFDPTKGVVAPLQFQGKNPDAEHEIELNRMHTLLHPECFERLILTLGLDSPARRLEVPHFLDARADDVPPQDRLRPEMLTERELVVIRRHLARNAIRRRDTSPQLLSILIDGREHTCLEIDRMSTAQINVDAGAEFIQLSSIEPDEEVLVAIFPLQYSDGKIVPATSSIALGYGRRLSFAVEAGSNGAHHSSAVVCVKCQKAGPFRIAASFLSSGWPSGESIKTGLPGSLRQPKLAFGILLLLICITSLLIYFFSKNSSTGEPFITDQRQGGNEQIDAATNGTAESEPTPPEIRATPQLRKNSLIASKVKDYDLNEDERVTRGRKSVASPLLSAIQKVHVDSLGGEAGSDQIRDLLIAQLKLSGRFDVVETRREADAVFKGSAKRLKRGKGLITLELRLVNVKGQVLWSSKHNRRGRLYSGYSAKVIETVVKDLLATLETPKRTQ